VVLQVRIKDREEQDRHSGEEEEQSQKAEDHIKIFEGKVTGWRGVSSEESL
jgi:hypothetical protein